MDPLDILPAELWGMIFEKVEEPQDWLNLYRASSSTFEGVVGDKRLHALLSKVFPHVYKHLDASLGGVLPLRLVSRKWKEVVDTILDSKEGDAVFDEGDIWHKYQFEDSASISSFMDKFGTHRGNPFIGSFAVFSFDPEGKTEEVMAEYEVTVIRFLNRFGMYIKTMDLDWAEANLDNVLRQIGSCIELTPNLEELYIAFHGSHRFVYVEANPDLANQQMPVISKLKSFYFDTDETAWKLTDLQDMIVRMCCNPDTLKIAKVVGVPSVLATFPKLEKAVLSLNSGIHIRDLKSNMANYSAPLSRLTLKQLDVISLVKCVEHFKESLISLKIHSSWNSWEITNVDSQLRLNLPHLKHLTIPWLLYNPFSLLENLFNLEELRVCQPKNPPYYYPNLRSFERFAVLVETEMSQFHIWETLPKLKKIKLTGTQTKIYVRDNTNKA